MSETETKYDIGIKGWLGWKRITVVNHRVQVAIDGASVSPRLIYKTPEGHTYSIDRIDSKSWCVFAAYYDVVKEFNEHVSEAVAIRSKEFEDENRRVQDNCRHLLEGSDKTIASLKMEKDLLAAKVDSLTQHIETMQANYQNEAAALEELQRRYLQSRGEVPWPDTEAPRSI